MPSAAYLVAWRQSMRMRRDQGGDGEQPAARDGRDAELFVDSWAASPRPSTANLAGSPAITHTILPHPPGTIPPPPPREPPPSKDQTKGMYALPTSMDT